VEVKVHYRVKISNRFAALENLGDTTDVGGTWNSVTEKINNSQVKKI
jgi:hypothetical protein